MSALPCPEISVKWLYSLFSSLGEVLRRRSIFSHHTRLEATNGLDVTSTCYGKTPLSSGFIGIHDLPSWVAASIRLGNKPISNANGQKKNENHFWGKPAHCTDPATIHLLQHLFTENQTIEASIGQTFNEVGYDRVYSSRLTYYPSQTGNQRIEGIRGEG